MTEPSSSADELRDVIARNVDHGLAAQETDALVYFAIVNAAMAVGDPSNGDRPIDGAVGAAVQAVSQAADAWRQSPDLPAGLAMLEGFGAMLEVLEPRRGMLAPRQAMHLEVAKVLIRKFSDQWSGRIQALFADPPSAGVKAQPSRPRRSGRPGRGPHPG